MSEVGNLIPVFAVKNILLSIEWYAKIFNFKVDWNSGCICSVSSGDHCLMLYEQHDLPTPSMAWIGLESETIFDVCKKNNVEIIKQPTNEDYAYNMKVKDLDGNILWLGTEPKSNGQNELHSHESSC
ncbi:MAG: hypothetical protein COA79_14505 [Planctomycetota bacterium]|nr:MAG: hypothetical protein COA79_14505 [Planctomycetota bacterium]